jgi:hypothetical protein
MLLSESILCLNSGADIRLAEQKDIMILLNLVRICTENGIKLPWDEVAQNIGPAVTGNAVIQHLAKLKKRVLLGTQISKSSGIYKPLKSGGAKSRLTKPFTTFQEDQSDMDPDDGDPDDSFGEKVKKRNARSRQIKKENNDDGDEYGVKKGKYKLSGKRPVKKHFSRLNQHEEESDTESESPKKKAGRRKSNALSKSSEDETDDDDVYVAAGSKLLSFNKYQPKTAQRKRKQEVTEISEESDGVKHQSKVVSLRFDSQESKAYLKKLTHASGSGSGSGSFEEAPKRYKQEIVNIGSFEPDFDPMHGMQNITPAMLMTRAPVTGDMFHNGFHHEMYMNAFHNESSQRLPALPTEGQNFTQNYNPGNAQMGYPSFTGNQNTGYQPMFLSPFVGQTGSNFFQEPNASGNASGLESTARNGVVGNLNATEDGNDTGNPGNIGEAGETGGHGDLGILSPAVPEDDDELIIGNHMMTFEDFV